MSPEPTIFDPEEATPESDAGSIHSEWEPPERPSTAVVEAVQAVTGEELTEMPPLNDAIDPDALDAVLAPRDARTQEFARVSFTYNGVRVRVDRENEIEIRSTAGESESPE
jgi:hypothetical protein